MTSKDGALIIALVVQEYLYHVLAEGGPLRIPLSAHIDSHYEGDRVQPHFIEVDVRFTFTEGMDVFVSLERSSLIQDIFHKVHGVDHYVPVSFAVEKLQICAFCILDRLREGASKANTLSIDLPRVLFPAREPSRSNKNIKRSKFFVY